MVTHSTLSRDLLSVFSGLEQGTQSPCLPGAYVLGRESDNKKLIHIIISDIDECYADSKRVKSEMCICVRVCVHVSFR